MIISGETRLNYWPEDAYQCGTAELGQSVQAAARPEERQGDRVLLRSASVGPDLASKM